MWNSDDSIDIGKLLPVVKSVFSDDRDLLSFMAGTHAGGNDENVVSGSDPAIVSSEALKFRNILFRQVLGFGSR